MAVEEVDLPSRVDRSLDDVWRSQGLNFRDVLDHEQVDEIGRKGSRGELGGYRER
jgi:hypothetical protein